MADQPDLIDVHVGTTIRARRKFAHISQGGLAEVIGVTFQQVQKYERGANRVSASMLARIADALETPIADFFPAPGAAAGVDPLLQLGATTGGYDLALAYLQLDPRRRESLLNVAVALTPDGEEPGRSYVSAGEHRGHAHA